MASRSVGREINSNHIKKNSESDFALSKEKRFALLKKEKQSTKDTKKRKSVPSASRGRESTFWKNVKDVTPNIFWTRIETYGTPGIPDLLGVLRSKKYQKNFSFWCELKVTKNYRLNISPFQISWNLKRFSLMRDNFIMAKALEERAVYIFSGAVVRELATVDMRELEPVCVVNQPWATNLEPALERALVDGSVSIANWQK